MYPDFTPATNNVIFILRLEHLRKVFMPWPIADWSLTDWLSLAGGCH